MTMPELDEYQSRFVNNVRRVVEANWLYRRPQIRILDMGCDTSGRQMAHLATLTRGEVVGINIPESFPTEDAKRIGGERTKLIRMDGMNLEFPDHSFDLVISANVMEHVSDPIRYISEAARVTKPAGITYFETAPVWTSARGHHVMESMVAENCPHETGFKDDGSIIPDWSHLKLDEAQMRDQIQSKVRPETANYIIWYLYHSNDLNRTPWSQVRTALEATFPITKITECPISVNDESKMPDDEREDYKVYGFAAVCRTKSQNGLMRRLIWRLRRFGL
jgi:ubiquinone/menaquinone biosynthesis C-methylase UbiE